MLRHLEELKLITRPDAETVDGHPLVREHFGAALEKNFPEAWKQAHSRLFDHFCAIPDRDQPDGEAGLLPLYQSLHHGVAAGRAQEALDDVYYWRISHGGEAHGVKKLGLFSTELAALAAFFPGGWQAPVQEVTSSDQGYLSNSAGFCLRALGRLKEAQIPFERNLALYKKLDDHLRSAFDSNNLSEVLLVSGEFQTALERANGPVSFIDRTEYKYRQSSYRAAQAHVLATQGKTREAKVLFEDAEQRQIQGNPTLPYLYSVHGFLYISFLLRSAPPSALPGLAERAQAALEDAVRNDQLLSIGLDRLSLARIAALAGDENTPAKLDAAIAALQRSGQRDEIPRSYLARAGFRRAQGDLDGAWKDLVQVRYIAEPSGMRLHLCDALIEEAWLHHDAGHAEKARVAFDQAEAEVNDMGYHWQDPELDKLRQELKPCGPAA